MRDAPRWPRLLVAHQDYAHSPTKGRHAMATPARTALITGASRGLGLALASGLAREGWRLVLDARGAQALAATSKELGQVCEVVAIPGDVTDAGHRQALKEA